MTIGLILIIISSIQSLNNTSQTELKISVDGNSKIISSIQLPIDENEAKIIVKEFCEPENPDAVYGYNTIKEVDDKWRIQIINMNDMCYATINVKNGETNCTKCSNTKMFPPFENQVIITTDKTEYEQGETIKITVRNNLDKSIWWIPDKCTEEPLDLFKYNKGNWEQIHFSINVLCKHISSEIAELKSTDSFEFLYGYYWKRFFTPGRYKIRFEYSINKPRNTELEEKTSIYSNEFTIKEKSALDPRCGEKVTSGDCDTISTCKGFSVGYGFDPSIKKCIEKIVDCSCHSFKTPFKTLEECQEVCEKGESNISLI